MSTEQTLQVNPSMIFREIGDQSLLVPIGTHVDEVRSLFTLNETAAFLYKKLKSPMTLEELHEEVINEFDCDDETQTRQWIEGAVDEFRKNNIIL